VAAQSLGMNKIVSEDALRRALERIAEGASAAWMRPALMHSVREVLDRAWVLDIDASIKPLYGRQEGAELGYNPGKTGRPSHVLHTFWVGNLRLVLDVQVSSGKQHTSVHAKAGLTRPCGLRERLRRVEEPMGAERLHVPGHQSLPDHGAGLRAGLQLVALVLQGGQPHGTNGDDHQQAAAAGRSGPGSTQRGSDDAVSHADAR